MRDMSCIMPNFERQFTMIEQVGIGFGREESQKLAFSIKKLF